MTRSAQADSEIAAGTRLVEDEGWTGAVVSAADNDPPDILITLADGRRIGAEVTRWTRSKHQAVELLDEQILGSAYRTFRPPDGSVIVVQAVPQVLRNPPPFEKSDVRGLARELLFHIEARTFSDDSPRTTVDIPETDAIASLWKSLRISRYNRAWAQAVFAAKVKTVSEATLDFDRYIAQCWRLVVHRPIIADPGLPGSSDAAALADQIDKKSKGLARWNNDLQERWLLITANELESARLWNFRWLDPEASEALRGSIPPNGFDAIAFVPISTLGRFKSVIVYQKRYDL
jgi:hypothetical protein